jgi:spermine oxidase
MDAIENMGFGKVNKIFLYFEKPFWTKGKGGVKLAWNHTSNSFEESQWYTSIFAFDEVLNNPKVLVAWVQRLHSKITVRSCSVWARTPC